MSVVCKEDLYKTLEELSAMNLEELKNYIQQLKDFDAEHFSLLIYNLENHIKIKDEQNEIL